VPTLGLPPARITPAPCVAASLDCLLPRIGNTLESVTQHRVVGFFFLNRRSGRAPSRIIMSRHPLATARILSIPHHHADAYAVAVLQDTVVKRFFLTNPIATLIEINRPCHGVASFSARR